MRLIHLHVENFGKLQNQNFSFSNGYNSFLYENGWGKSTLAAFLKVMLYGFDNERSRDDYSNERKRYRPWQGGVYGGSMTFEAGGKVYVVTRAFGLKEKEDVFTLREESTNLESRDFSPNLGEELFGIDRASFERTVFLSQNDCETKATDRIHAKIGNLTESLDDMSQFEKADGKLNDLLNSMSPVRKTGSLYRLKEQISLLESEVRKMDQLNVAFEVLQNEKRERKEEYDHLKKRQQELTEIQRKASVYKDLQAKRERYAVLLKICQERSKEAEEYRTAFTRELPKAEELDRRISQCITLAAEENTVNIYRLSELEQNNFERWESEFQAGAKTDKLDLKEEKEDADNTRKQLPFVLFGIGILTTFFGIILFFQKVSAGILLLAAGIMMTVTGLIQYQKYRISKEYEAVLLENQRNEINNTFSEYEKLRAKKNLYEEAFNSYEATKETIENYIRELGFLPEPMLQRQLLKLKTRLEGYEAAKREADRAREEKELFEELENMEQIHETSSFWDDFSMEETEKNLRNIQERMEFCQRKILQVETQIQDYLQKREELSVKEEQLALLQEHFYKDTVKYERIKMTKAYLSQAKASFTAKYRNPLMKAFSRYYEKLSGQEADAYNLDANIELTIQEQGNQRESRYLSAGWKDLIGVCMRMALVDAMYKEEKPFLLFDDPFVNLDQEKTRAGVDFIKKISKEYQVIYFTCHESRKIR